MKIYAKRINKEEYMRENLNLVRPFLYVFKVSHISGKGPIVYYKSNAENKEEELIADDIAKEDFKKEFKELFNND